MIKKTLAVFATAATLALATQASAAVVVCTGTCPAPDTNVLINAAAMVPLVTGSAGSTVVNFTSGTDLLDGPANGQARVEASDGTLNSLTFSLVNATFGLAEFFLNPLNGRPTDPDHATEATIFWFNAQSGLNGSQTVTISPNGNAANQNRITVYGDAGERFDGLSFVFGPNSLQGIGDLRQLRLGNVIANVTGGVPEPTTWAMMIVGFGAVGGAMRRRKAITARTATA